MATLLPWVLLDSRVARGRRGGGFSRHHGGRRRRQLTSQNGSTGERFTGFIHFLRQTYGFIRRDTTGAEDVFMHLVDVDFEPRRGDRVSFALTEYRKRLCGNQPVRRVLATPSSRRRVDGVEDDAIIQHEHAVKF